MSMIDFSCLESWRLFMLVENRENGWKSKKIVKTHAEREMTANGVLESGFLCLETPKEF